MEKNKKKSEFEISKKIQKFKFRKEKSEGQAVD